MNAKDIQAHKAVASSMDYFELTSIVSEIVSEKRQLISFLSPKELEKYDELIDIYEKERKLVIYLLTMRNHSTLIH